ncbi:MAG: tetratricopeptide repeat protein [Flavobacteriales bacterium]|nr:tetratricopeptide repeat protein [Flavobacteriales bacterium]
MPKAKRGLLLLLCLASQLGHTTAQVNVDSLWNVWDNATQHDTARMQAMDFLCFDHYMYLDPDTAYVLAGDLLALAERANSLKYMAIASNAQGASLQLRGDYPRALRKYERTMAFLGRMGDSRRMGILHANMGSILSDLGEDRRALAHCDSSLKRCTMVGDTACMGNAILNSGTSLLKLGDTTAAYSRFEAAARLHEHSNDERSLALALGNLGMLNRAKGEFGIAEGQLLRALSIAERIGDDRQRSILLRSIGTLRQQQGRTNEAIAFTERSLAVAQGSSMAAEVYDAAGTLHQLYKSNGQLAKALAMHELYAQMMDSLHNEKGREEMLRANLDFNYRQQTLADSLAHVADKEQLENERVIAAVKAANQRRLLIAILVAVLVIGGAVTWSIIDRRRRKAEFEREQAVLQERMRIASDMHDDLGAGLSGLKLRSEMALRTEKDPLRRDQLGAMAKGAGELIGSMRQIIWTMDQAQSTLEDLVIYTTSYARNYCEQNNLAITLETPPSAWPDELLSIEQRRNIFLVVKEALHNVVKHAQARQVRIVLGYDEGLAISISDDGIGLAEGSNLGLGNGLRNMARRMETIGGTFHVPLHASQDGATGTMIRIHLPSQGKKRSIAPKPPADKASRP